MNILRLALLALLAPGLAPAQALAAPDRAVAVVRGQIRPLPAGDTLIVNDDPYDASGWDGSTAVPTKNALRDKIETLGGSGTVTSVDLDGGATGLTSSGGPVTGSGTITLGGTLDLDNGGTGATTASAARTALGVAIGSDVQAYDADLTTYAGITPSANVQTLLGAASFAAFRTDLGLGSLATQSGTFSGTSSGTNTGDQTSVTGNAGTATALQTARNINGVAFDGTGNITINAVDATARVPETRTISTTAPLTGGGDLSANRTLTISAATTGAAGSMSAADKTKLDAISGTNTGDQDLSSYATTAAVAAAYQPLDADLTAVAALATTGFGRGLLDDADAAAGRSSLALGTLATQSGTFAGTSSGTNTGDQASIVGIAGSLAEFNTALTGADFASGGGTATGTNTGDQTITLTGDATGSGTGNFATTVARINGTSLAGLATGILRNTTTTGVPSIAVAGDFPTLNQSTTGSAATLTTPRTISLTGKATAAGGTFDGSAALAINVTALTVDGAIVPSSVASTGAISTSSASAAIGYATGAGSAVTQATNKTTAVTCSKPTCKITMASTALAAATIVAFTLTNTVLGATDHLLCSHVSGGTSAAYTVNAFPGAGSAVVSVRNNTAGSLSDAIVLRCSVIDSVDS